MWKKAPWEFHDHSVNPIFAGGTSVSSALECPEEEKRTIVSLDTSQMVCLSTFFFLKLSYGYFE